MSKAYVRPVDSCKSCKDRKPIVARGLCNTCYQRHKYHNTIDRYKRTTIGYSLPDGEKPTELIPIMMTEDMKFAIERVAKANQISQMAVMRNAFLDYLGEQDEKK